MTVTRMIARPLLASAFVLGAATALKNSKAMAAKAEPVTDKLTPLLTKAVPAAPTNPQTLVQLNAAAQIAAALALATGKAPRLGGTVLAVSLVPTTIAGHAFWNETDPAARKQQQLNFAKNVSMLGGVMLAAVDTDAKPGIAWRTKRAAKDVRREAKALKRTAKLEARLAAKSLPGTS